MTPLYIRLFTVYGDPVIVARRDWEGSRRLLPVYDRNGYRKSITARTAKERQRAANGVHRANLFTTLNAAITAYEEQFDTFKRTHAEGTAAKGRP